MKKRNIFAACMAMTMLLCSCGSNTSDSTADNGSSEPAATAAADQNGADSDSGSESSEDAAASDTDTADDLYVSIDAYRFHFQTGFEVLPMAAYKLIYQKTLDSGVKVYYDLNASLDYAKVHPDEPFTVNDVPDILFDNILKDIDVANLPAGEANSTYTVDTEETKEMLGTDVLRRTGTLKLSKFGEEKEVVYAACYICPPVKNGDIPQAPISWMAFSEDTSDETKAYLEEVVDYTCEKSEIVS